MHFSQAYSHHNGHDQWKDRDLDEWLTDVFERPDLSVGRSTSTSIRNHVRSELASEGWAYDVRIDQNFDLTIFGLKDDLAFHLQTGNISRAAYDLLKLQHLFQCRRIEAGALALPMKAAANRMGSNIAHFERIMSELMLFDRTITVPLFLVGFE
jgi:hypothetical protein